LEHVHLELAPGSPKVTSASIESLTFGPGPKYQQPTVTSWILMEFNVMSY
jgi:hypothetical protein